MGHPNAREILEALVGFPTVSRDSNLPLIDWVEGYLSSLGIQAFRVPKEGDPTKHGLFCSVGPDAPGGVVLSGHTDVVPVDGQDWNTDPWVVSERDGKLFGRGTCDMKGFDALALHALQKASNSDLKSPLQVALSFDEEIGCAGAPPLVNAMQDTVPKAEIAIIGEPSMMKCVTGHKGSMGYDVHVRGFEVHSSLMHTGVNAIMSAAELIVWANARNAENQAQTPGAMAALFEPPWTTLHMGQIKGGTAHNITAADCFFDFDFRFTPDADVEDWTKRLFDKVAEIEKHIKAIHPDAGFTLEESFNVPSLLPEKEGAAEARVRAITGDNANHVVSYGTEAGHFQSGGYSTVVCGPGSIEQAHQANEFISIAQFEAGEAFLSELIDTMCVRS